jgi:hypothetical protein
MNFPQRRPIRGFSKLVRIPEPIGGLNPRLGHRAHSADQDDVASCRSNVEGQI